MEDGREEGKEAKVIILMAESELAGEREGRGKNKSGKRNAQAQRERERATPVRMTLVKIMAFPRRRRPCSALLPFRLSALSDPSPNDMNMISRTYLP